MKLVLFFALMAIVGIVRAAPWDVRFQQENAIGNIIGGWVANNPTTGQTGFYAQDGNTGGLSWVIVGTGLTVASGVMSATAGAQVNSDWNAVSGVEQILNKPSVVSAFTNDSGYITSSALSPYLTTATAASTYATQINLTNGLATKFNSPSGSTAQYVRGDGSLATLPSVPSQVINDAPGRTLVTATNATGFQISATRNALACYEGYITTTSTIGGPSSAVVNLETADTNSTTPGDWTTKAQQAYANNITLAIVLNQQQANNWQICRMIPAGKYVRIRAGSILGTASVVLNTTQQETLQ